MRAIQRLFRVDVGLRAEDEKEERAMPEGMRAVRLERFGGDYDELKAVEVPRPEAAGGRVLVRMSVAAVNPLDDTVRRGYFPAAKEPPLVLGNEGVGIVVDPGASGFAEGARVMVSGAYGVMQDGTWREYAAAEPGDLVPAPASLSDEEAAGVPVVWLTAQLALTYLGGFSPGQTVLVPAVGGAVGNAAVQLARAQGAARVVTTAGSAEKAERARSLGYEDVIDLSQESLGAGVARLTGGEGVDLAINSPGGEVTGQALAALKAGGTLVTLGYSAGTEATVGLLDLISKNARVLGFNLFAQPPEAFGEGWEAVLRLLDEGKVRPLVARAFPLEEAAEALRHLIEERPFGKVVLTL